MKQDHAKRTLILFKLMNKLSASILIYADRIESNDEIDIIIINTRKSYEFISNGNKGPLSYIEQGITILEPPTNIGFKEMGV